MTKESREADEKLAEAMARADLSLSTELTRAATKLENVSENLAEMRGSVTVNATSLRNNSDRLSKAEAKLEYLEKALDKLEKK